LNHDGHENNKEEQEIFPSHCRAPVFVISSEPQPHRIKMSDTGQVRSGKERDIEVFRLSSSLKCLEICESDFTTVPPLNSVSQ
jgi:hypothetical protein